MNRNGQMVISKTTIPSSNHQFARIWEMECSKCKNQYKANSCDAHNRKCPYCQGGKQGE